MNITVVIFKKIDSENKLVELQPDVFILNSNLCERHEAFPLLKDRWLCFFDHDCFYTESLLNQVRRHVESIDSSEVIAGIYSNPLLPTRLQVAHNFVANQWLLQTHNKEIKNMLGGFFVVNSSQQVQGINYSGLPRWGGEDQALADVFQKAGLKIRIISDLVVEHRTSSQLSHFFNRAFYHGLNCPDVSPAQLSLKKIRNWFFLMKDLALSVRFFVLLHFLILVLAKLVRPILRTSTSSKSEQDKRQIF